MFYCKLRREMLTIIQSYKKLVLHIFTVTVSLLEQCKHQKRSIKPHHAIHIQRLPVLA